MIEKLYSIVSGKTCQGIFNDLGEELIPKGKKYTLKLLNKLMIILTLWILHGV